MTAVETIWMTRISRITEGTYRCQNKVSPVSETSEAKCERKRGKYFALIPIGKSKPDVGEAGDSAIPKGLSPSAQGCPATREATLGYQQRCGSTPSGLCRIFDRGPQPPLGLAALALFSQGSSFLATLGFGAESLWDSFSEFSRGIRSSALQQIIRPGASGGGRDRGRC